MSVVNMKERMELIKQVVTDETGMDTSAMNDDELIRLPNIRDYAEKAKALYKAAKKPLNNSGVPKHTSALSQNTHVPVLTSTEEWPELLTATLPVKSQNHKKVTQPVRSRQTEIAQAELSWAHKREITACHDDSTSAPTKDVQSPSSVVRSIDQPSSSFATIALSSDDDPRLHHNNNNDRHSNNYRHNNNDDSGGDRYSDRHSNNYRHNNNDDSGGDRYSDRHSNNYRHNNNDDSDRYSNGVDSPGVPKRHQRYTDRYGHPVQRQQDPRQPIVYDRPPQAVQRDGRSSRRRSVHKARDSTHARRDDKHHSPRRSKSTRKHEPPTRHTSKSMGRSKTMSSLTTVPCSLPLGECSGDGADLLYDCIRLIRLLEMLGLFEGTHDFAEIAIEGLDSAFWNLPSCRLHEFIEFGVSAISRIRQLPTALSCGIATPIATAAKLQGDPRAPPRSAKTQRLPAASVNAAPSDFNALLAAKQKEESECRSDHSSTCAVCSDDGCTRASSEHSSGGADLLRVELGATEALPCDCTASRLLEWLNDAPVSYKGVLVANAALKWELVALFVRSVSQCGVVFPMFA